MIYIFRQFFVYHVLFSEQEIPWKFECLTSLSVKINTEIFANDKELRSDLFTYSNKIRLLAFCSKNTLFLLKGLF
jgi:hypothetical protein